jgi:hypothetical protein
VFNRKKVRLLENELQEIRLAFDEFRVNAGCETEEKDRKITELTAALTELTAVLIDVAGLVGDSNIQARELISGAVAEDLDDQTLPSVDIKISIVDIKEAGVSKEIGAFSQSFSYALSEFLKRPSISSITSGTELYRDIDHVALMEALRRRDLTAKYTTYKRATTEIAIHSRYIAPLEEVTGAVLSFLEKTFEQRDAQVQIREMSKEESPAISYRVQIG